jgi:Outer membrane protein beta-barrel domain
MKNSLLFALCFWLSSIILNAQTTKPATTTVKKTPVKTTTTTKAPVKTTTKTVVKKPVTTKTVTTTTSQPAPAPVQKVEVAPTPAPAPEPVGPPNTGRVGDGPKSYTNTGAATGGPSTVNNTSKTSKTSVAKVDKQKPAKMNVGERVRSYIGIRGGYNLATGQDLQKALDENSPGSTAKVADLAGYMGGIVLNIGVSKAFSIQPEVLYSQQGAQINDGADYFKAKIDFVNVPLLLKLAFGSPKVKFFINAGPYVGYKLSQKQETSVGGIKSSSTVDFVTDYDSDGMKDNRIDFGGIGGAGLQFNLGGPLLVLEGRYQYGMADPDLYKDGKPASVGDMGHTRVMTGTLGILFPLGR